MKLKSLLFNRCFALALWFVPAAFTANTPLETGAVEQLTGLQGTLNQKEAAFKVSFPRKNIQPTIAGAR